MAVEVLRVDGIFRMGRGRETVIARVMEGKSGESAVTEARKNASRKKKK